MVQREFWSSFQKLWWNVQREKRYMTLVTTHLYTSQVIFKQQVY